MQVRGPFAPAMAASVMFEVVARFLKSTSLLRRARGRTLFQVSGFPHVSHMLCDSLLKIARVQA